MAPFVLGITGGIGSGKSAVSRLLASYCLRPMVDVDQCCRHLLDVGQPGWQALHDHFGQTFLLADQRVHRAALRQALFADADLRRQVDALLHPLAREMLRREVEQCVAPAVLVEVPLLYEAGWQDEVNAVLVVYSRKGRQCCRIMQRDGVSRKKAAQAIASQMSLSGKVLRADYCIDNSGSWHRTRLEVIRLGNALCEGFPGIF